jgi:nicotinamide mononucleotide transporter
VHAFCAWLALHGSSCLELVAVLFGIVSVYLSVRENIWSWPTALVNVALSSVVYFKSGLYSDQGLQIVYFVLSLYGWYEWLYGGKNKTPLPVTLTSRRTAMVLVVIGVVVWLVLGTITSRLPGVAVPFVDAAMVAISLTAQWMMTRKLLENWLVWIAVDVGYVALFIWRGLYFFAVNFAVYLVLAVLGYYAWKKSRVVAA